MFCEKCGKEVEDTWKRCPYCGESLIEDMEKTENDINSSSSEEHPIHEEGRNKYKIIRIILKAVSIIAFVCFFCPLYMVSCAGQELLSVSGADLMLGIEYMGEQMEGNLAYGLLGIFPFLGVCSAFRFRKKFVLTKNYAKLKEIFYEISIAGGSTIAVIYFFTKALNKAFDGSGLTIDTCTALTIMILGSLVLLILAGYQAYQLENDGKSRILKCFGRIFGGVVFGFIIAMILLYMFGGMNLDTITQKYEPDALEKQTEVDFSELDMETFFGETGGKLEEQGFEKNEETGEYTALGGAVYVSCTNDTVDAIMLKGTDENIPAFHGVRTGMGLSEAEPILADTYFPTGQADNQAAYLNMDTGVNVVLETEGEEIKTITVTQLSEEEIANYMQNMYVFPDSDKKYLSEDEVRSVEVDRLALGRNEIFARHGYIFDDDTYKQYFESMPWYEGTVPADQFNADEVFNDFEKKNAELIKKVEDEINGVNQASSFIGMDGTYICTSSGEGGFTGKIEISNVTDTTLEYSLSALELSYSMLNGQAQIIDSNTAQITEGGLTISLIWSDSENLHVTNSGFIGDWMDAATIDIITDDKEYTRPLEFNQW